MISILHGDDESSSYERLSSILKKYPDSQSIRLSVSNTYDDLVKDLFSQDFFESQKNIVCENFLKDKKYGKNIDLFTEIPKGTVLIFWEQSLLTAATLAKFQKVASIEVFKKPAKIFWFLDSLSPSYRKNIKNLTAVLDEEALLWHVTNRLLLLTLAKLNLTTHDVSAFMGRNILDWQWQKTKSQALAFDLNSLLNLYQGLLKIDYLAKAGKTSLGEKDLIPFALLKYQQA